MAAVTPKDINNYIFNFVIHSAKKDIPFIWNDITEPLGRVYNTELPDVGQMVEKFISGFYLYIDTNGNRYTNQLFALQNNGIIKKVPDNSNKYVLTEKGEKIKDAGSIEKYEKKEKRNALIGVAKNIIVYVVTPLTALIGIVYPIFKKEQSPTVVIIKRLCKEDTVYNFNKPTDSSKSATNKSKPLHP